MADDARTDDHAADDVVARAPPPSVSCSRLGQWRLWVLGAVVLAVAVVAIIIWLRPKAEERFDVDLIVAIRSKDGSSAVSIQEADALPVREGQAMQLQVSFNQPALAWLVWFDGQGQAIPLYPWNNDDLEVKDANVPAERRPAKFLINPMTLGRGWKFDNRGGLETVLLLARRTPLGKDVRLGSLLGSLPAAKMRHPRELAILGLDRRADTSAGPGQVTTLLAVERGRDEETRKVDQPLLALMAKLQEHFELIRAIRFAHEGK